MEIVGSNPTPTKGDVFRRSSLIGKIGVSKIFDVGSSPASSVLFKFFFFFFRKRGGVAEWFKASVLKIEKNLYSSWVRIPSPSLVDCVLFVLALNYVCGFGCIAQ